MDKESYIISLNVGGVTKNISKNILIKSPVFDNLLVEKNYQNKEIFIDRDPKLFDDIVLYLAWDIIPKEKASLYELDHYGIYIEDDENEEKMLFIEGLSTILIEEILDINIKPFYISACGTTYVTTINRLKKIGYFSGLFSGYFKDVTVENSKTNPYAVDIPSKYFQNILLHLRDERNVLLSQSYEILKVLGFEFKFEHQKNYKIINNDIIDNCTGTGPILDLVAQGPENYVLNGESKSIWKSHYNKITNSSLNKFHIPLDKNSDSTVFHSSKIHTCDLLRKITLHIDIMLNNQKIIFTDNNDIIYKLINKIEISSNGNIIDSLDGYQIHMICLMKNNPQEILLNTKYNIINIPFSFSSHNANALPVISLSDIHIELTLNKNILDDSFQINPKLYGYGVLLDTSERRYVAQNPHNYLNSHYHKIDEFIFSETSMWHILNFKHPTKAIFFTLHDEKGNIVEDLISFNLTFSNQLRWGGGKIDCGVINRIESNINPEAPVFVIPFALDPLNDEQPTTHVNFSVIDAVKLMLSVKKNVKSAKVWGNYWNVLNIKDGLSVITFN